MGVVETCILYLLLGGVVAVALVLRAEGKSGGARVVTFVAGVFFWPVYAPFLLSPARPAGAAAVTQPGRAAQERLRAALGQVEGLAADVLRPEVARLRGLVDAMGKMEARVAEMDALLATPEFNRRVALEQLEALSRRGLTPEDPRVQSVQARLRNMERLGEMRERTAGDLERVVLRLEEMGSRLQLLKFAGRPDAELVELLQSVAASVEEVTEGLLAAS
jgi:hypothetical protein